MENNIKWNENIKLIFSDVDETIADVYSPAKKEMIFELESLLSEGKIIFMMSGAGLESIRERIIDAIEPKLRKNILVAHCSGAEVWGFDDNGEANQDPFYSLYEEQLNDAQKKEFRKIANELISEFKLKTYPTMPKVEFRKLSKGDPLAIMLADRRAQITFEMVNSYDLTAEQERELEVNIPLTNGCYDLRIPILERAEQMFAARKIPITPRLAGTCALDFSVKGVSKTTAVHWFFCNEQVLSKFKLHHKTLLDNPNFIEVWGDKFSVINGGTDRHMSEGLPKQVRSIDFREEDKEELPQEYNIQVWQGEHHLHDGLLEYLQSRH